MRAFNPLAVHSLCNPATLTPGSRVPATPGVNSVSRSEDPSVRVKGKIASWDDGKGYGFVTPIDGGRRLFIHVSAFSNRSRRPEVNEIVTYTPARDRQGRPCAANATLAGDKLGPKARNRKNGAAMIFAALFLIAIAVSVSLGSLPLVILIGYFALSVITFVAYALDKSAARNGSWRVSEGNLLVLGLLGGWPGATIAQEILRHKSKKASFRTAFWITVIANCAAVAWLHTVSGKEALRGLLG